MFVFISIQIGVIGNLGFSNYRMGFYIQLQLIATNSGGMWTLIAMRSSNNSAAHSLYLGGRRTILFTNNMRLGLLSLDFTFSLQLVPRMSPFHH